MVSQNRTEILPEPRRAQVVPLYAHWRLTRGSPAMSAAKSKEFPGDGAALAAAGRSYNFQLLCRGAMEFIVALSRHFGDL